MSKIKVGIIGAAGYTGGELLRILIHHPEVEIVFANSNSNSGKKVYEVHTDLFGDTELSFSNTDIQDIDVLFLCSGHGNTRPLLEKQKIANNIKIIDLAQDFRLKALNKFGDKTFVYGLPELNKSTIEKSNYIANPGCFATSIILALLPLASQQLVPEDIYIQSITGSTGAGQRPTATTHFSWRDSNVSAYKVHTHQHLQEISESINQLQSNYLPSTDAPLLEKAMEKINLIPLRGDFPRGIFTTVQLKTDKSYEDLYALFNAYYKDAAFTHVSPFEINLKQVVNTNKAIINLQKSGDNLFIACAVDNLLKGASGQAVQNMNLMFGIDEKTGLKLKSNGF